MVRTSAPYRATRFIETQNASNLLISQEKKLTVSSNIFVPRLSMDEKVKRIEREFAEARKEIMQLRVENRKLETALTMLSKPMVLSDDESEEPGTKRRRSEGTEGSAIVIALPQGEAQERIDALLQENLKLADEIAQLRGGGNVSAYFEALQARVTELEESLREQEKQHVGSVKQVQIKAEKDSRQFNARIMYVRVEQNCTESVGNWSKNLIKLNRNLLFRGMHSNPHNMRIIFH